MDDNNNNNNNKNDLVLKQDSDDWVMVMDSPSRDSSSNSSISSKEERDVAAMDNDHTEPEDDSSVVITPPVIKKNGSTTATGNANTGKKNKKKALTKTEDHPDGPVTKKPRVKPEKVKQVRDGMLALLVKNYAMGIKNVPLATLASGLKYKNPRSDAIVEAVKMLKEENVMTKTKEICTMTADAIEEHVGQVPVAEDPEQATEQFWNQFQMKLDSQDKTKGKKAKVAAKQVWDLIKDGKAYSVEEMVGVTTYKARNSSGFEGIMTAFKDLKFLEKDGKKFRFHDNMFPFGRP